MKVTKNQLRNIIREAVRRKLEMDPGEALVEFDTPLNIVGPSVTHKQLQRVINEEFELALALREKLSPGIMMGNNPKSKHSPPPLPPHSRGSTPPELRNKSAPGERLRQFKSHINMLANAVSKAQDSSVNEALPWLDKIIHFASLARDSVKQ